MTRLALPVLLFLAAPALAGELELEARDAITVVGRRVELSAKLTKRVGPLRPDQEGRTLEFQLGQAKASGRTDSDGVGRASLAPVTTGIVPFTVRVSDDPRTQIKGRLWVLAPERPVVICDIDGTLSDMSGLRVPVSGWRAKAFPGAPELLRALAKTHAVVYLTARDQSFRAASLGFLRKHDFPLGPLLLNSWGLDRGSQREQFLPSRHGRFKLQVLERLQARGLKLVMGIGDKPGDAEAYEGAGIRSLIRSETAVGERSIVFPDYATLRKRLAAEGLVSK